MATIHSERLPRKNFLVIGKRRAFEYVIDIAKAAGIFHDIVMSIDSDEFVADIEDLGVNWVMRDSEWSRSSVDYTLARSLEKWERESGMIYDTCTMLHGSAVFWRPSWIRVANRILDEGHRCDVDKRTIDRVVADVQGCFAYKLDRYLPPDFIFSMDHRGPVLDINTPNDLENARIMMRGFEANNYDPKRDISHEYLDVIRRILTANMQIGGILERIS